MIAFSKEDIFLVCGASSGIGAACTGLINELGGSVIAVSRRSDKLEALRATLKYPQNYFIEPYDLSSYEGIPAWINGLYKKYGVLSGAVYSAGIVNVMPMAFEEKESLRNIFDINFNPAFFMIKAFGGNKKILKNPSSVVFISSLSYKMSSKGIGAYASSKGALSSLTVSAALELAKNNIRVNAVSPGIVETPLTDNGCSDTYMASLKDRYPLGLGRPQDVADLVVFLLSSRSLWITGQNYCIDGGASIS